MNGETAARRRAAMRQAHKRLTRVRAPGMTWIGVHVLIDLAIADLAEAIAIEEKTSRSGRRPDGGNT